MRYLLTQIACCFGVIASPVIAAKPREVVAQSSAYPVVILGGGIGALTSATYMGRAGIEPLVIEGSNPGGLITQSHSVQNWPGEMEISGTDLAEKVRKQAEANGAHFEKGEVIGVDFSKRPYGITLRSFQSGKETKILADSVIIAMGTTPNFLGIEGEKTYWGRGVTNCAICDGALYKDQVVGVVGGGDAAVLEALYLANIAKEVHIFIRKAGFKAVAEEKRLETLINQSNIKIHTNAELAKIEGNGDGVTSVVLKSGEKIGVDGVFLAIGSKPNTKLFQGALALDNRGYIKLNKDQETSVTGVYAIGDIVDPVYKQAISAAGDGAKAAMQAQEFLHHDANFASRAKTIGAPSEIVPTLIEVIEITSAEQFQKELQSSDVPVFVDFYAHWCGPCKRIAPMIDTSAEHLSGKVKFLKVNVDINSALTSQYQIRSMPTAILFDPQGQVVDRKIGSDQITDLLKKLESDQK